MSEYLWTLVALNENSSFILYVVFKTSLTTTKLQIKSALFIPESFSTVKNIHTYERQNPFWNPIKMRSFSLYSSLI